MKATARLFLDERTLWPNGQFVIGLAGGQHTSFCKAHPDLVKNWIRAHVELTDWINAHLPEAKKILNEQIQTETGKALACRRFSTRRFPRLQVTYDPLHTAAELRPRNRRSTTDSWAGRCPIFPDSTILTLLNQVLAEKGRKAIQ